MDVQQVINEIESEKIRFCVDKPTKVVGAITVEILRQHFLKNGIPVSRGNVFIRTVKPEIDLIIPKKDAKPRHNIIYEPEDVIVALEIKYTGCRGEPGIEKVKNDFNTITNKYSNITCCYLTVSDGRKYLWRMTVDKLDHKYKVYTLSWHSRDVITFENEPTQDWERLIHDIKSLL